MLAKCDAGIEALWLVSTLPHIVFRLIVEDKVSCIPSASKIDRVQLNFINAGMALVNQLQQCWKTDRQYCLLLSDYFTKTRKEHNQQLQ